jgi:4-alpha-glucanotransferase
MANCGLPGMKVLQFAFGTNAKNTHLPHNIVQNSVCYTGTHDNNTLLGWIRSAPPKERRFAREYLGVARQEDLPDAILSAALASKADLAIIPLPDWLGLGARARINKPGTEGGRNWKWKIPQGALTPGLASRIRHATKDLNNR